MKRGWWNYIPHALLVVAALALLYRLRSALAPFAIAYILAAVLDPVVQRMEARGRRRGFAVFGIFAIFLLVFLGLLMVVVPVVVGQVKQLSDQVDGYVEEAPALVMMLRERLDALPLPSFVRDRLGDLSLPEYLSTLVEKHAEPAYKALVKQVGPWTQGIVGSLGFLIWLVIIPIATFYLLMDIPRIRARFLMLVPGKHRSTAQDIAHDVAEVFLSYLRGLSLVSVLYGLLLLVILVALGAPYALALAILAGILYPVPYLGPLITTVTIFLVTSVTVGWGKGALSGAAVLGANVVFDQVLTPRIVGRSVGLHPVLSMIALLVGADLFGLLGMVLAVPAAGALQVMALRLLPRLRQDAPPPEEMPLPVEPAPEKVAAAKLAPAKAAPAKAAPAKEPRPRRSR